jgi:hypothetical protein
VARQTIYDRIDERRVERPLDAIRLPCLWFCDRKPAGDDVEKLAAPRDEAAVGIVECLAFLSVSFFR